MSINFSFIIIDDGELDCYVTQKFLERIDKNLLVKTFQSAHQALEVIRGGYWNSGSQHTVILLDLQMPLMNGFKFVEEFEKLAPEVQKNYSIIILSILNSATNPADIARILSYDKVNSIIEKPLTKEKLFLLLQQAESSINIL
ncbi:MAG TPA: response regulator [Mucilaginibacter sp.]|jgi:CheY-like chemotaxis protein